MAKQSLRNILKTQGGQLAETSTEELSKLAGRPVQPLQPMEGAVIGGNKDQAKMLGTKAQKTSALRQSLQEPERLQTALRRGQTRRQATAQELEQRERGERLEQLGSLEDRVEKLAQSQLAKAGQAQADVQLGVNAETPEEQALLEKIRSNPSDVAAIAEYNKLKGRTQASNVLSADEILQQFDAQAGLGDALAGSVDDGIEAGLVNFQDMGFQDSDEVASLLGVPPEQVGGMSVQELVDQVNAAIENEYTQVADLQQQASDPFLGAAERAEARKRLREAGAVGVRSLESDIDKMADEIAESNTITFMGQDMSVEELLSDDHLTGVVANFFDDPNFADKLKENEPELVNFITRHEQVLKDAASDVEQGVKEFAQIQQDNLEIGKAGGQKLSSEVMQNIFPDYGEITTDRYDRAQSPLLQYLDDPRATTEQKATTIASLNDLARSRPNLSSQLAKLNKAEIDALGFNGRDPEARKKTQDYFDTLDKYQARRGRMSESDFLEFIGPNQSPEETRRQIDKAMRMIDSGFATENLPFSKDYVNGTTNFNQLSAMLENNYGSQKSLADLAARGVPESFSSLNEKINNINNKDSAAFGLIEKHLQDGPVLTRGDVRDIASENTLDDLEVILQGTKDKRAVTGKVRDQLRKVATQKFVPELDEVVGRAAEGFSDFNHILGSLRGGATDNRDHNDRVLRNVSAVLDDLKNTARTYEAGSLRRTMADNAIRMIGKLGQAYRGQHHKVIEGQKSPIRPVPGAAPLSLGEDSVTRLTDEESRAVRDRLNKPKPTSRFVAGGKSGFTTT